VPYKGAAPALLDLIGGRVDAYFLGLPAVMPHVNGGNVRLLAVSSARRASSASDTPTVAELGIAPFDFSLWGGIFAPAGTPGDIVARLNRAITEVLTREDVRAKMAQEGSNVVRTTPEEFGGFVQAETAKYAAILKAMKP
jgi:tripartite-type tricarboxylate transporter receptor subunit TctC